ncbi:MAG: hypothetical protein JSV12_03635 [Candidatus Bathyarchaeota archaeon]|nr:MAG: hypothetical protein JSV12_03635 [Candidatus Bathyarchaeota archaeon]
MCYSWKDTVNAVVMEIVCFIRRVMLIGKVKVGDMMKILADGKFHPERGHRGKCVWISEDGETVAVQCERSHNSKENTVFILKFDFEE